MPSLFELVLRNESGGAAQASQPVAGIEQFLGEIRAGLRQTSQEWASFSDLVEERGQRTTASLKTGFEGLFRKTFKGEVITAQDVFQVFCDFLATVFGKTVSKMASDWAGSALSGVLRGFAPIETGAGLDLSGGFPPSAVGEVTRVAAASEPVRASVMAALPSSESRHALGAVRASGNVHPAASSQPVAAGNTGTPPNIEVRIENHGVDIGQASARTIQMDPEKMVIGIIVKNVNQGGALRSLMGTAQKR